MATRRPRLSGPNAARLAAPPEGVVAVLFTDMVGSTELLSRLGDDAAEELRHTHFQLLRAAVMEAGGHEVKNVGDGLMVVFTSPVAAVHCAVAMQRAVDAHGARHPDRRFSVRVGLHPGEPLRDEGDFFGTAVVVAKRLCDRAQGGQILASELLTSLIGSRGGFVVRPLGRLPLKGLPEPVAAGAVEWRNDVGGAGASPAPPERRRPRPPSPRGPRLVGRDRELALLQAELERSDRGEFRCVLMMGDPGVGKSRLAGEVLGRRRRGRIGLMARAFPLGETTPFGLWAEAVEQHLKDLDAHEIAELCGGFGGDLASVLPSVAALRGGGGQGEPPRSRLIEGIAALITKLAEVSGLVVLLDDVHLADASSWEVLHRLAHMTSTARLLVVATARRTELDDRQIATEVLLGVEQDGVLRRLVLQPLEVDGVRDLAAAVIDQAPPTSLVTWLAERSRGNPLFVLGLLHALLDEGADLAAPRLQTIPEALADRVRSRLRRLDEPAVGVLEMLAVLGRRTDLRTLVDLSGGRFDELATVLERLVRSRLVVEVELGATLGHEISHPLIQQAIYEGIGRARRRHLHRLAGRCLHADGRLGEAAPHFARSADSGDDEAIDVLRAALRQTEEREAHREALTILASLADLIPPGDPRWAQVVDAMTWGAEWVVDHRGDSHAALGVDAMRRIDAVLEGLSDPARRAVVKFRLASFLVWGTGDLEEGQRICSQAIALFEEAGDGRAALLGRHELTYIHGLAGDLARMQSGAAQVAEAAEAAGERSVLLRALRTLATAAMQRGRFHESEAASTRASDVARADGNSYALAACLTIRSVMLAFLGRTAEAEQWIAQAKAAHPGWRDSYPLLEHQAMLHWATGDYCRALASGVDALSTSPGAGSKRRGLGISTAALAALEAGQLVEARRLVGHCAALYGGRDWGWFSGVADHAAAVLAWHEGDRKEALSRLRRTASRLSDMGAWMMAAPALLDLADLGATDGERALVEEAVARLGDMALEVGVEFARGMKQLGGAWLALSSDAPQRAADRARDAVALLSGEGHRAYRGRAYDVLGRALSMGHRRAAAQAFTAAAAEFDACGATWRRKRALEGLRVLGGSQGRRGLAAALGATSLSRREREISALAVRGLTARDIGEQLFIGERTVEAHLAQVYAKLGIHSRVELARRATQLGLDTPD